MKKYLVLMVCMVFWMSNMHSTKKKSYLRTWKSNKSQIKDKKNQSQLKDKMEKAKTKVRKDDEDSSENKAAVSTSQLSGQNELTDLIDKKIISDSQKSNIIVDDDMRFKKIQSDVINKINEENKVVASNEVQDKKPTQNDNGVKDQATNQEMFKQQQEVYNKQIQKKDDPANNAAMKQAVSNSVPEKANYEQIPKSWENVNYTTSGLSTYTKKFLREVNDPAYKNKGLLIGKPLYIENNITYDEQPSVYIESEPRMTGVNVVQRQYNTQEKHDLWNKRLQEEFKQNFKDVTFNPDDPIEDNDSFSGIDNILKNKKVKIQLANKRKGKKWVPRPDQILDNVANPIKKQVYTKQTDTNYQMNYINEANKETPLQSIKRMKQVGKNQNPMQQYMGYQSLNGQNMVNNNNVNIGFLQYLQQQNAMKMPQMPRFNQMSSMSQFNLNQPNNMDLLSQLKNQQQIFSQASPFGMNNYNYLNVPPTMPPTLQLNQLIMSPLQRNMMANNMIQFNRFRK